MTHGFTPSRFSIIQGSMEPTSTTTFFERRRFARFLAGASVCVFERLERSNPIYSVSLGGLAIV